MSLLLFAIKKIKAKKKVTKGSKLVCAYIYIYLKMARKKIREYDGKRLIAHHLQARHSIQLGGTSGVSGSVVQIKQSQIQRTQSPSSFYNNLSQQYPWLLTSQLVVKPDMLFGKRGKHSLVLLKADYEGVQMFIEKRMGEEIVIGGVSGKLNTFLIEEFVEHEKEYYFSISTDRRGEVLRFGGVGGVDIEENWEMVREVLVPVLDDGDDGNGSGLDEEKYIVPLLEGSEVEEREREVLIRFIKGCYYTYVELDMCLLEMNPLAIDKECMPVPLDIRVELDSYASFKNTRLWGKELEFPEPWGREKCYEERQVQGLDEKSGASMKLSVLNEKGRIWTMVAGGGASVIYADTVVDLGYGHELANYAEYSGNPKEQETYLYARTILNLATKDPNGKGRVLLIGGGVANFTDVAATFTGIIQALKDFHGKLQDAKVKIFVRRGGPNYKTGLRMMEDLGKELDIPIEVHGPEANMTQIVEEGIRYIEAF